MDKQTWTDLRTTRLDNGSDYKAIILLIAWFIYFSCVHINVKYSFRWCIYSIFMNISPNFSPHTVFSFNTSLNIYLNSLSHVKFYLSCVYKIFGLPVCIKVFYTQLGGRHTGLVVRASESGSGDPGSILGRVGVLFP